jgi:hypothetical protein
LPQLPLVLAEVLDDERLYADNPQQALARSVDGKPAKIRRDPTPVQALSHRWCGTGPAKAIKYQITWIGRGFDNPL